MIKIVESFNGLYFLPKNKQQEIKTLMRIYKDLDRELIRFRKRTSLSCLPGCGECCRTACVSASVLEMQPFAADCLGTGEYENWLSKIDPKDEKAQCIFYSTEVLKDGGHCHIYRYRPLICRLFGFSARQNKFQRNELMLCGRMKDYYVNESNKAQAMVLNGMDVPISRDYVMKAYAGFSVSANQCMNINLAFKRAVEVVGLYKDLNKSVRTF